MTGTAQLRIGHLDADDVERITRSFLVEGPERGRVLSSFWTLLVLSAVIAAAGVVADSVATVIGAMIVAPLMRPILGTACAVVLARRQQLVVNLALVAAGATVVVAIGYVLGLTVQLDVVAETNSQVSGRVSPRLIDLVAALATGTVGAYAVVRSDVSDSLPGVAIAISLVPPLSVVGLTLESGAGEQAVGALLLFGTNVAAIIATGTVVFLLAGLRRTARASGAEVGRLAGRTLVVVLSSLALVAVPLTIGSQRLVSEQLTIAAARPAAEAWAADEGWRVTDVFVRNGVLHVVALGARPQARPAELRAGLDAAGLEDVDLEVTLVVGGTRELPGR